MTTPRAKGATIELRGLAMSYGGVRVLRDIDLRVEAGEFVTFLGPSGSGKTTTLNLIAGFLQPERGDILLDGRDLTRIPAYQRGIGVVFQSYALFPHMTVAENIAYPLQQRRPRPDRASIDRRVQAVLELVQMREFAGRRPDQLSGGQQQRVALARAVVFEPQLLLLDEPLGALDKRLRESLQGELRRIHRELGVTVVFVTHDQDEALSLSDRIVLFHEGAIEQVGTPEGIYDRPRTAFAATFLGDSNLFEGQLVLGRFAGPAAATFAPLAGEPDGALTLMVRPEHMAILPAAGELPAGVDNAVPVTIDDVIFAGATVRVEAIGPGGQRLLAQSHRLDRGLVPGTAARFAWPAAATRLLRGGR